MSSSRKILLLSELLVKVDNWKSEKDIVVFTNGCFDILHAGHIDYLEKAKSLGDKLVVGLNSDVSVEKIKGKGRPIQNQNSRALVLAAMEFIDSVVLFDQETPETIIMAIDPNVLVKGGDYTEENIVGAKYVKSRGGEVGVIPFLEGYSSSKIIEKIRREG